MKTSKRLIIFEGPDGAGKSYASRFLAEKLDAQRFHMPAFKRFHHGISRFYVEAMSPALRGHTDVVMDRCWISEEPYGIAYRAGADRIGATRCRMLERLAMRCQVVIVLALPDFDTIKKTFQSRRGQEMLANESQLRQVYDWYEQRWHPDLPTIDYDYTKEHALDRLFADVLDDFKYQKAHPLESDSAGNLDAPILIVGEGRADYRQEEPFYRWPFGSLSGAGCSAWLTDGLESNLIPESVLCWANHDDRGLHHLLSRSHWRLIVALGDRASITLKASGVSHTAIPHPQFWKRFRAGELYPLYSAINEVLAA